MKRYVLQSFVTMSDYLRQSPQHLDQSLRYKVLTNYPFSSIQSLHSLPTEFTTCPIRNIQLIGISIRAGTPGNTCLRLSQIKGILGI